jgi:hypothetical protein
MRTTTTLRLLLIAATLGLAACDDSSLTLDVSSDPPADTTLQEVRVAITGVSLQRDDGSSADFEFDEPESVDLLDFDDSRLLRLLDGEKLDEGRYTGLRLLFSDDGDDNRVTVQNGGQFDLTIDGIADFIPLDFEAEDDNGEQYEARLVYDLRFALTPAEDSNDAYVFRPRGRAVLDEDAAEVRGNVADSLVTGSSCRDGRNAGVGVAVYAFQGHDVEADEFDGIGVEPYASALVQSAGSGDWTYRLRDLPAGDYTLAVTCHADSENPGEDDDIEFRGERRNVDPEDGEQVQSNIGS